MDDSISPDLADRMGMLIEPEAPYLPFIWWTSWPQLKGLLDTRMPFVEQLSAAVLK